MKGKLLILIMTCILIVGVVFATPETRELWKVVEGSGAANGNAWIDSANAGRGIDWLPGDVAGNGTGWDELAVLTGTGDGSLVQIMRAWDGKNLGSFAMTGTGDSTLPLYRLATSDDGKIFANGFEGSVMMAYNDVATTISKVINQTGSGIQSRALEVVGSFDDGTCTVFVGKNLTVEVWGQSAPGSEVFTLLGVVDMSVEGLTGVITSIGAVDDTQFIVCSATGGEAIKLMTKTGLGAYTFTSNLSQYVVFVKQGLDWDGSNLYVMGEAGGAQDGYAMALMTTGHISPIAGLDTDADNVYDAGATDLNAANLVVDICLQPNSCMAYGYGSDGGAADAAVCAIYYDEPATVSGVDNSPTEFKNMYDALEYLKVNNPNDPKRLNITTDGPIIESKPVDTRTSCSTGLFIDGDADLNATACTVITSPVLAADMVWVEDPRYGVLFDYDLSNAYYGLQYVTVMPRYEGDDMMAVAGDFGLYPILVDEADEVTYNATGYRLDMTDCVCGGAKAGQVLAADPDTNEHTACTRPNGWEFWSHGEAGIRNLINIEGLESYNSDYRGIAIFSDYSEINVGAGTIACWSAEEALSCSGFYGSTLSMVGTAEKRNLFRGSGQYDVDEEGGFFSTNEAGQFVAMKYCDFIENGAETDFNEAIPETVENCFFAYNDQAHSSSSSNGNFRVGVEVGLPQTCNMISCTIHNNANATYPWGINFGWGGTDGLTLNCTNVIISGDGDTGIVGNAGAVSTVNLTGCALVNDGPDALATETNPGGLTINQVNTMNDDPAYARYDYAYGDTADFLRVTNLAYIGAGSDITGAGGAIGPDYQYKGSEYTNADANLTIQVDNGDLINAVRGTLLSGGFHSATVPGTDPERLDTLTDGTWAANGLTVIAADTDASTNPSCEIEYTFTNATIERIALFAGHDGDGSRGFINCQVDVDTGSGYSQLLSNMMTGSFGDSPSSAVSSYARVVNTNGLATGVQKLKFTFENVAHNSTQFFQAPDDNTTNPPLNYPNTGTILKEIDVFGTDYTGIEDWLLY